jgi:Ca-activated chloride channel family protein
MEISTGLADPEQLKDYIAKQRDSSIYLPVLGFGRGDLDDASLQALAQNGNGQATYIDTLSEASKVLVDQLTGALFPIANDVKIQVEFNSAKISEYRLIGYETRAFKREDFNNGKVDAGDIGAGHQVTALYEITPITRDNISDD